MLYEDRISITIRMKIINNHNLNIEKKYQLSSVIILNFFPFNIL